jgi:hypothetical protein
LLQVLNAFIDNWPANASYLAGAELASIAAGMVTRACRANQKKLRNCLVLFFCRCIAALS